MRIVKLTFCEVNKHRRRGRKLRTKWWIEDVPTYYVDGEPCVRCGPYDSYQEAKSDRDGMQYVFDQMKGDHRA